MPVETHLSEAALAVLRVRVEGGSREVNDSNREAYRELERAGIMYAVSGFSSGPEYLFRWTDEGYARRFELSGCAGRAVIGWGESDCVAPLSADQDHDLEMASSELGRGPLPSSPAPFHNLQDLSRLVADR